MRSDERFVDMGNVGKRSLWALIVLAAVLSAAAASAGGADVSDAAVTSGDINDSGGTGIGTWSYDDSSNYLTLTFTSSVQPADLVGFTHASDTVRVTVKGNNLDISAALTSLSIPSSADLLYQGTIPQINGCAEGVWTYDVSEKTITLTKTSSGTWYGLYNAYTSSSAHTMWYDMFFKGDVEKAVIDGYQTAGRYIFNDFNGLKTVESSSMKDFDREMFQYTSVKNISFTNLVTLNTDRLNGLESLETVNLPSATAVNDRAFSGCNSLTTAVLGNSVRIGNSSFLNCTALASVSAEKIYSLGYMSLKGCSNLGPQSFPLLTSMDQYVFDGCTSMTSATMPALTTINSNGFRGSSIAGDLTFNSLNTVSDSAFYGCTGITSINMPSVTLIANSAFFGCTSLASATLSEDLTSLGASAFWDCNSLESVSTLGKITAINSDTFRNSGLTSLTIPSTVINIHARAFYQCNSLTGIEIPAGVINIYDSAFQGCVGLLGLKLNEGLKAISTYAFDGCASLGGTPDGSGSYTAVSMPDSLTTISNNAFSGCSSLKGISFGSGSLLSSVGSNAFRGCGNLTGSLNFGNQLTSIGASAFYGTPITGLKFGSGSAVIESEAFRGCTGLVSLDLGTGITQISALAFYGCAALKGTADISGSYTAVSMPDTLQTIKYQAFDSCTSLVGVNFSGVSALTTLENRAFSNCRALAGTVTIPNGVTAIDYQTFSGCTSLQSVTAGSLTSIGTSAFEGCTTLASMTCSGTADLTIGNNAFIRCSSLGSVSLGGAVSIGTNAFYQCTSLASADFSKVTTIGNSAFFQCTALTSISMPKVVTIDVSAFQGCSALIGTSGGNLSTDNLQTVGNSAFRDCRNLIGFTGNSIVTVGDTAFYNCTSLVSALSMPNVTTIGSQAFGLTAVSSFAFGKDLSSIGTDAIFQDLNLSSITVDSSNQSYTTVEGILYDKSVNVLMICPAKMVKNGLIIPDTVNTIYKSAFYHSSITGEVVLPEYLTSVGVNAFRGSSGITSVVVKSTAATLFTVNQNNNVFYECPGITKLTVPISVQLHAVFDTGTRISEFHFTGNGASALATNYYLSNWGSMPWSWWNYSGWQISVTFEDGVTAVDPYMFYRNDVNRASITSVTLADSVREIGANAFYNCNKITTLTLSDGLQSAGSNAFYNCSGVTNLTVPISFKMDVGTNSSNTHITTLRFTPGTGEGAAYTSSSSANLFWHNCPRYTLILDEGIVSIGDYSYLNAANTVTFPSTLRSIGQYAFSGAPLSALALNSGLQSIGSNAFGNCTNLTGLTVPDSVETIAEGAFAGCTALRSLTLPIGLKYTSSMFENCPVHTFAFTAGSSFGEGFDYDESSAAGTPWRASCTSRDISVSFTGVKSIGDYMFAGCWSSSGSSFYGLSGSIFFPSGLTEIGTHAFDGCAKVTSVSLDGISDIGAYAFRGCTGMTALTVGDSVIDVGTGAFSGCTGIRNLSMPISFNAAGSSDAPIFDGCTGIRSITFTGTSGFAYSDSGDGDYHRTPWYYSKANSISLTLAPTVTSVGSYMFAGCTGISGALSIPSNLAGIGKYAFSGCTGITSLEIKGSPMLGDGAFDGCTGIRNLAFPVSFNTVGNTARPIFRGCTGIRALTVTGTVGYDYLINSDYTPWHYSRNNSIVLTVESSVQRIGAKMFAGCTELTGTGGTLNLSGITSIGDGAFQDCTKFTAVTGESVTTSGTAVFKGCTSMSSADLPRMTSVPDSMFEGCTGLTSVTLGTLTSIGNSAFAETQSLSLFNGSSTLSLTEVTSLGNSAFKHSGVINVTVGKEGTALTIGNYAFQECAQLMSLTVDGTISDFKTSTLSGSSAFESMLTTLNVRHANQFSATLSGFSHLTAVDISGTTSFGSTEGTFKNCTALVTVVLFNDASSSSTVVLPKSMFEGCTSLSIVNLEKAELRNGREFYGCTSLDTADLTMSPSVSQEAFFGCTALIHFSAPQAISIGARAFASSGLQSVSDSMFPEVQSLGAGAFSGCTSLATVSLPAATESSGSEAFRGCTALTSFSAPGLQAIPAEMLRGCSLLTSVSVPAAASIAERAFSDCYRLASLEMPAAVRVGITSDISEIDTEEDTTPAVFLGCTALASVKMPVLTDVGPMAFYGCDHLVLFNSTSKMDLSSVRNVGFAAFAGTGAKQVVLGSADIGSGTVGNMAFYGCASLTSFSAPGITDLPAGLFGNVGKETAVLTPELVSISVPSVVTFDADLHGCTKLANVNAQSAQSFADGVFYGCTALRSISMPAASSLGSSVFEGCTALASVTAPALSTIGSKAFYGCTALASLNGAGAVSLTDVTSIGDEAFGSCVGINTVMLGGNLADLGDGAFRGCTSISKVSLPISADSVGNPSDPAFSGCTGVTSVVFTGSGAGHDYSESDYALTPWHMSTASSVAVDFGSSASVGAYTFKGLTALKGTLSLSIPIGAHAFDGCTGLTSLVLSGSAAVSESSFAGCTSVRSMSLPIGMNTVVSAESPAFEGCASVTSLAFTGTDGYAYSELSDGSACTLTPWYLSRNGTLSLSLASSVTSIGDSMFYGCTGLTGPLSLSSALKSVGAHAFEGCTGLTALTISRTDTALGSGSFSGCTGIASLTLPVDVNSVCDDGNPAFSGCTGITQVSFTGTAGVDYLDHPSAQNKNYKNTPWYISSVSGRSISMSFAHTVDHIGDNAFRDCASLSGNIVIPGSITSIGSYAFAGCKNISALTIERVLSIGDGGFTGCSGIQALSIPADLNTAGGSSPSFSGCTGITSVTLTGYVRGCDYSEDNYITTPWYYSKSNAISLTVADGVISIGTRTFRDCTGLSGTVSLPNSVSSIGQEAFCGCTGMTGVSGPQVLTAGTAAFSECSSMLSASLPSMTKVGESVFDGCAKLSSATFGNCTEIGKYAFRNSGIKQINSSDNTVSLTGVRVVGEGAFAGSAVTDVVLGSSGASLTMGDKVFQGCTSLLSLKVYGTIAELPSATFMAAGSHSATKLKKLIIPTVTRFTMDMSSGFSDLEEVDISGATTLGQAGQFKNCVSLAKVTLISGSTRSLTLPASMFEGCRSLETINLDRANLLLQNGREFYGCSSLNNVVLGISEYISPSAFEGCASLTSFSAPAAATVGNRAFAGSGLTSITSGTMPLAASFGTYVFDGCASLQSAAFSDRTVSLGAYAFSGCASLESFSAAGLTGIPEGSFSGCSVLSSVTAGSAVSVGALAFSGCTALVSLTLESAESIGTEVSVPVSASDASKYAVFGGCINLGSVTMPALKLVGDFAFYGCSVLTSVNASGAYALSSAEYIGSYAFAETGAKTVTVGTSGGIESVGNYAFYGCTSLTAFSSPSLKSLPANLFNSSASSDPCKVPMLQSISVPAAVSFLADLHGCTALTSVVMTSAETFADGTFYGCTSLVSAEMPAAKAIAPYQFYGCRALASVSAPVATSVGDYAFSGCVTLSSLNSGTGLNPFIRITSVGGHAFESTALRSVTLGPRTSYLGESAFEGCGSLRSAVIPDSLTSIGAYAFRNSPLSTVYIAASVTSIGEGAFDYTGIPGTASAAFWFNGTANSAMAASIVPCPGMSVTVHADSDSRSAFSGSFTFVQEVSSTVSVLLPAGQETYKAIYGGMIVLPYGASADYYFTMVGASSTIKVYASDSDFSSGITARSGMAVPVYPLSKNVPVVFTGNVSDAGDATFTITSSEGTSPLSQTAHYGSLMAVPEFDNDKLVVLSVAIYRGSEVFYLDASASSVRAGYIFDRFELVSEDMEVTVTIAKGDSPGTAVSVYYDHVFGERSSFKNPADYNLFKSMEVPADGYSFEGWYDSNGIKAVPGTSKFVAGQTYTAKFSSIEYTITFTGDHIQGAGPVTVRGPFTFTVGSDPASGLTLVCADDTYPSGRDISLKTVGYKVIGYFNTTDFTELATGQTFTKNISVEVTFEERQFSITVRFSDSGATISGTEFEMNGWTQYGIHKRAGTQIPDNKYMDGDVIDSIPYSAVAAGFAVPTPLHSMYSLNKAFCGGTAITSVTYAIFSDSSSDAEITFLMNSGIYWISYSINDDAGNKVPATTSCRAGGYFTVVPFLSTYTKTGYTFEGYRILGIDGLFMPNYQYQLTDEMAAAADMCYLTMEGSWKPVEYTVRFSLGEDYTGEAPADLTGVIVDSDEHGVKLPAVSAPTGHKVGYWYWTGISGSVGDEHYVSDFRLTKQMIDSFASDRVLILSVSWVSKTYTVSVDTTGMSETQANAVKANYPDMEAVYGQPGTSIWSIGDYTLNIHTRFGGWTAGGQTIASGAAFTVGAELAAVGDANSDVIAFSMIWNEISFALSYNLSGGMVIGTMPNTSYYAYGDPITLWAPGESEIVRAGYTFGGWSYYEGGAPWTGTTLDDSLAVAGHGNDGKIVMYAVWDRQTYGIEYDLNNGTAGSSTPRTAEYASEVHIDAPSRSGYVFAGWTSSDLSVHAQYKTESGFRGWSGGAVAATVFLNLTDDPGKTVKLTATWSRATYAITVDWNGGEGTYTLRQTMISLGQTLTLPVASDSSRVGYAFAGWVLNVGDTAVLRDGTAFTREMAPSSGDKFVLYASWTPASYTIEYRDRDTQSYRSITAQYDEPTMLVPGTRSGYEFAGWSITGAGSSAVPMVSTDGSSWNRIGDLSLAYGTYFKNLSVSGGETVRFDAVWTPISYTIVYDANGGTADPPVDSSVYTVGDQISLADSSVLGKMGNKSAVGWSLERGDSNSAISVTKFTEGLASNADAGGIITFYAVWKAGQCRVSLDLSGVSVSGAPSDWTVADGVYTKTVDGSSDLKEILSDWDGASLSKDGYHFEGWNRTSGTVNSDIVISPEFEKVDQSLIWVLAGVLAVFVCAAVIVARMRS